MVVRDFSVVLERICTVLRADLRTRGLDQALQPVQLEALLYLATCNRYSDTPGAVTEYLGLTKGTVSQTLKVLERRGLIRKRGDVGDRRRVRLELTDDGRQVADRLALPEPLERAMAGAGFEVARMVDDLRRLLTQLQRATGNRSFGTCRTCRFFADQGDGFRCGLTGEPLTAADAARICREHEPTP